MLLPRVEDRSRAGQAEPPPPARPEAQVPRDPAGVAAVWAISYPIILSTCRWIVMVLVDRLCLSRYGPDELAACGSGGTMAFFFLCFFMTSAGYVGTLAGQYKGAGRLRHCGRAAWQGLWLALISYAAVLALIPLGEQLFMRSDHQPAVKALESTYFRVLVLGSVFTLAGSVLASFFCGLGRTRLVMWANLSAMAANVPLTIMLVFGVPSAGIPAMGIAGAALSTIAASALAMLILGIAFFSRGFRATCGTASEYRPNRDMMLRLMRFGMPAGFEVFLAMGAFALFMLLVGDMGRTEQIAINVTLSWCHFSFLPMMGIGGGVSVLVAQHCGAGRPDLARRTACSGMKLANLYALFVAVVFLAFPGALVRLFIPAGDGSEALFEMSRVLVMLTVVYVFFDANLLVIGGALRGAGDTRFILVASGLLHWFTFAVPCWALVRIAHASIYVVWMSWLGFIVLMLVVYVARFRGGKWRNVRVIEEVPACAPGPAPQGEFAP